MTTPDDGVREIHLSGKQLVFLFMAVTVVSVVIFLCGVLVGRGVQARSALDRRAGDRRGRARCRSAAGRRRAGGAGAQRTDARVPT